MTAATVRKAIGSAVVAAVSAAYAAFSADSFNFGSVTIGQWETIALAAVTGFTAVYHLTNAPAPDPTAKLPTDLPDLPTDLPVGL